MNDIAAARSFDLVNQIILRKNTNALRKKWRVQEGLLPAFTDISGWRDELEDLRNGPAYKAIYPNKIWNPKNDPLVPLSVAIDFVDTLLLHSATRDASLALDRWHKKNPPVGNTFPDPENDPTFPHTESNLLSEFAHWYMLKTRFGPRYAAYIAGLGLATAILRGEIPAVRSPEAVQYFKDRARIHVDFDR